MDVNPLIQIKEAIWVFVVAFGLTWFGPSSSVHAVSPPPEGGYPDEIAGFSARQTRTAQAENLAPPAGLKPVKQEAWLAMARRLGGAGETVTAGSTGTNIQSPLATASWTGAVNTLWSNAGNWTAGGPPGATGNARFDANFTTNHQPDANGVTTGGIWITSTVTRNVTISGSLLTIAGNVAPTNGIRVDNSAFTLTMNPPTILTRDQTWTNNSTLAGNALIVNGINNLAGQQVTFDGIGNTLVVGVMGGSGGSIVKNGTGTTTFTAVNTYGGPTTVNGGLLLVNGDQLNSNGLTTVNSGGALGGSGILGAAVVVNSGGNLAPGSGGNTTGILRSVGGLTLNAGSNFRIDINGTTVGTGYDRFVSGTVGAVAITGSNLTVHVGGTIMIGDTFLILDKTSGGAITGQFAQGTQVIADNGDIFSISYTGGSGNDVVLTFTGLGAPPSRPTPTPRPRPTPPPRP
jgi:autotransporter-associated beta strand protein